MICIYINDNAHHCEPTQTLQDILTHHQPGDLQFAVTVNQQVVQRIHYQDTVLRDGDRVDIIVPLQGG
jgi:sulfur carrier protein